MNPAIYMSILLMTLAVFLLIFTRALSEQDPLSAMSHADRSAVMMLLLFGGSFVYMILAPLF